MYELIDESYLQLYKYCCHEVDKNDQDIPEKDQIRQKKSKILGKNKITLYFILNK